jgi:glycosyltransferase involved in cell wall biosynthesis
VPDPLRVLVVPSWYPSPRHPSYGVFNKEQALAVGALRPDWSVAIATWGQGVHEFALRTPGEWPGRLRAYLTSGPSRIELLPNVVEHHRRAAMYGSSGGVVRATRRVAQEVIAELGGIDVIHAHTSYPAGAVAERLGRELGISYVVTEHWHRFPHPSFVGRDGQLARRVRDPLERAAAVMAVSRAQAEEIGAYGIEGVEVVTPAIDEERFTPEPRRSDGRTVFLAVGTLEPRKGLDDLLHAFAAARRSGFELRVGGSGPEAERLESLTRDLGLSDSVTWLGAISRDHVRREMQACDCFVLPSHKESFGVVYVEAMACGRPVIAARSGGPEDFVTPRTGLLVDVGDVNALTEALTCVASEPQRWQPEVIRQHFLSRFSRPAVVDRLEAVYRAAIAR